MAAALISSMRWSKAKAQSIRGECSERRQSDLLSDAVAMRWPMFRKIQKVIRHINVHMGETITISDLAKAAGLSRSRLCDLFKTETGLAPMQYVRRRRIEHARELFETTSLSVTEVRLMVGLPDRSHFAREFKGSFGATPSEYRRRKPKETDAKIPPR